MEWGKKGKRTGRAGRLNIISSPFTVPKIDHNFWDCMISSNILQIKRSLGRKDIINLFYRWGTWGSLSFSEMLKVTKLVSSNKIIFRSMDSTQCFYLFLTKSNLDVSKKFIIYNQHKWWRWHNDSNWHIISSITTSILNTENLDMQALPFQVFYYVLTHWILVSTLWETYSYFIVEETRQ